MFLDLSSYLVGDRFNPGSLRKIQVRAEDRGEFLGRYEDFIGIPNETISYPMRLGLELDADWDQTRGFGSLGFEFIVRA